MISSVIVRWFIVSELFFDIFFSYVAPRLANNDKMAALARVRSRKNAAQFFLAYSFH